jgi:hypothetical protein
MLVVEKCGDALCGEAGDATAFGIAPRSEHKNDDDGFECDACVATIATVS